MTFDNSDNTQTYSNSVRPRTGGGITMTVKLLKGIVTAAMASIAAAATIFSVSAYDI